MFCRLCHFVCFNVYVLFVHFLFFQVLMEILQVWNLKLHVPHALVGLTAKD